MTELKVGDSFPEGVAFSYAPITPESSEITSCGIPQKFDASEGKPPTSPVSFPNLHLVIGRTRDSHPAEFKKKKVVLVSVPGAFTPTCSVSHIPSYIQNADKLKAQGVDQIVVIAFNDAWVMSAWGKANGIKDEFIVSLSLLSPHGNYTRTRLANSCCPRFLPATPTPSSARASVGPPESGPLAMPLSSTTVRLPTPPRRRGVASRSLVPRLSSPSCKRGRH